MDPRDFNQVAIDLIVGRPPTGPAAFRSAISRAYYGALIVATDVLNTLGHSPGKSDSQHMKVVFYLQHSGDMALETTGRYINTLRTARNRADYDMMHIPVEGLSFAKDMVEFASKAIDHLDQFAADPARKRSAADAIAKYKSKISTP
jgi:hypothetical protein